MFGPPEGRVHIVASRIQRSGGSPRFDRIAPHHNARGADANWFSLPDQGSLESALIDRERRGVQP
jgi:hypothetical protein